MTEPQRASLDVKTNTILTGVVVFVIGAAVWQYLVQPQLNKVL